MIDYENSQSVTLTVSYPKDFAALDGDKTDHQVLILDDLPPSDFKIFPNQKRKNIEHAT